MNNPSLLNRTTDGQASRTPKKSAQRRRFAIPTSPQPDAPSSPSPSTTTHSMIDDLSPLDSATPSETMTDDSNTVSNQPPLDLSLATTAQPPILPKMRNISTKPHSNNLGSLYTPQSSTSSARIPFVNYSSPHSTNSSLSDIKINRNILTAIKDALTVDTNPTNDTQTMTSARQDSLRSPTPVSDPIPLVTFEDVQLHISQLLLESHLNTIYHPDSGIGPQRHIQMTNFILPPESIKNTTYSPWERQDSIGPSILSHLLSPQPNSNPNDAPSLTTSSTIVANSPFSMVENASVSLMALRKSILCQNQWSDATAVRFYKVMQQYQGVFFNSRTTKTAQKGVVNEISDYINYFFHPNEYLTGHSVYSQLLQSLSNSSYRAIVELHGTPINLPTATSTNPLDAFASLITANLTPIQNEKDIFKSITESGAQYQSIGNPHKMSVLHNFYEYLFALLILGNYSAAIELCLHPFFHNTPHFQPLLYLANMIIFNFKISNPLFTSPSTTTALNKLSIQIALSLNPSSQASPIEELSIDELYHDELAALPRNPQDRFVYQSHLWKSQAFGNHVNYRLAKTNKLYYILKLISGDYHDTLPVIYSTLYQSTTLANNLYQPLLATVQQQLSQRNLVEIAVENGGNSQRLPSASPLSSQSLSPEQANFLQIVDQQLETRFLRSWGWLIALIFALYHVDSNSDKLDESQVSIFDLPHRTHSSARNTTNCSDGHVSSFLCLHQLLNKTYSLLFPANEHTEHRSNNLFLTLIELFTSLFELMSVEKNHQRLDFTPLWTIFLNLSKPEQLLFPIATLGLQKQFIISSLPDTFMSALGLSVVHTNTISNTRHSKPKVGALPAALKRLLPTIVPAYQPDDETILQHVTNAIGCSSNHPSASSSHPPAQSHTATISPLLQSLNLKWFSTHALLSFFISLSELVPNSNINNNLSQFSTNLLPFEESPIFTAQTIIFQFKHVLLTYKQWQWACYITQHTIHQSQPDDQDDPGTITPISSSLPQALLSFESTSPQTDSDKSVSGELGHIRDVWEILVEYISPIPRDELISLKSDTQQHSFADDSRSSPYPLPPCPEWLNEETFKTITYYLALLHSLGLSTNHLSQYYSQVKRLEAMAPPHTDSLTHVTTAHSLLDSSLLFNSNLLNDSLLNSTAMTDESDPTPKLPTLADEIQNAGNGVGSASNNNQHSSLNIVAQTVISGFQVGLEEIGDVVQLLTILFILEQEGQNLDFTSPPREEPSHTQLGAAQTLNKLVQSLFKPSQRMSNIDTIFTSQSITQLKAIIGPLQLYIDEYQAQCPLEAPFAAKYSGSRPVGTDTGSFVEFPNIQTQTNSLTDQWLIRYCHVPDIIITLARYLQLIASSSVTTAALESKNQLFGFFLMLKLEQQWTQHCLNYTTTPLIYTNVDSVFNQRSVPRLYQLNQTTNSHKSTSRISTFFCHIPKQHNILLSGSITSPHILSLLQDLTTFEPTLIPIPQQNQLLNSSSENSPFIFPTSNAASAVPQFQLAIPISQFLIQRYPIHTTFISTFSTYITPLLLRLSARHQHQQQPEESDPEALAMTYFQDQLTHLTCLFFLPQVNHWAEHSQFVDPELYLNYIHTQINPVYDNLEQDSIRQHLASLSMKLIQLTTREATEMIFNYTEYYSIGLVHRFSTLTETIESFLVDHLDSNGNLVWIPTSETESHPIGIVCDSIDLLSGDLDFIIQVGNPVFTRSLHQYVDRLIAAKSSLFLLFQ